MCIGPFSIQQQMVCLMPGSWRNHSSKCNCNNKSQYRKSHIFLWPRNHINLCTWIGGILTFLLLILVFLPWYRRVWYISFYGVLSLTWAIFFVTRSYIIINLSNESLELYNEYCFGLFHYNKRICYIKEFCGITITPYDGSTAYILINLLSNDKFGLYRLSKSASKHTIEHYISILKEIQSNVLSKDIFQPYLDQIYWRDNTKDLFLTWNDNVIITKTLEEQAKDEEIAKENAKKREIELQVAREEYAKKEQQKNEEQKQIAIEIENDKKIESENMEYETKLRDIILDAKLMKNPKAKELDLAFELDKKSLVIEYKVLSNKKNINKDVLFDLLCDKGDTIINISKGQGIVGNLSNASAPPADDGIDGDGDNNITGNEGDNDGYMEGGEGGNGVSNDDNVGPGVGYTMQ